MSDINKLIVEVNEILPELKERILKNSNEDRKASLKLFLFSSLLERAIALYSSGTDRIQVTTSLLEAITAFEEGFKWEGFAKSYGMYDQMVWMLSLGILCEVEDEDFKRIVSVIKRDGVKDRLIKTLVNYRLPNEMDGLSYLQKSPYAALDILVIGQNKSASFIKNYLDKKWYQGHSDAPWYDSHKRTKVNTYFGYWAWEVGALAKIYSVDDSSLANQQYYPYRAVHW